MNIRFSTVFVNIVCASAAALWAAVAHGYELTTAPNPENPTISVNSGKSQRIDKAPYKFTLPDNANRLSVTATWLAGAASAGDCEKQLKLLRVNNGDENPTIGISCIQFHLDWGPPGIADIQNIASVYPRYFDRYLTSKAAVWYYYYNLCPRFGTRVLEALAIWYAETKSLMKEQDNRPFKLEYDVELAEVIDWVLGNPRFKDDDFTHACPDVEPAKCRDQLREYSKAKPQ